MFSIFNGATTFRITPLSTMTLSIKTFIILVLSIQVSYVTLRISDTQHR